MSYNLQDDLQCRICNKTFASAKGLQQHHAVHTGVKAHQCEICSQVFRFKSNLWEHMSVHTGSTPYLCPYCGKACRLKGNLKKHLRFHVTTAEELEAAWRPFSSKKVAAAPMGNRSLRERDMDDTVEMDDSNAMDDSNVGRASDFHGIALVQEKKPVGLGKTSDWVARIKNGSLLPQPNLDFKLTRIEDTIEHNPDIRTVSDLVEQAKSIAFDPFNCPICHSPFATKTDCILHCEYDHPNQLEQFEHFCEKCVRPFADKGSYKQHMEYHGRIEIFRKKNPEEVEIMMPVQEQLEELVAEQQQFQIGRENQPIYY